MPDGEEVNLIVVPANARRTPGPITTGAYDCAELVLQLSQNLDRWLWVTAQGRDDEDYFATPISRKYVNTPG
jgi:hypothetical protein